MNAVVDIDLDGTDRTGSGQGQTPDPLLAAIAAVARHFDVALPRDRFSTLARNGEGKVPFHQVDLALDLAGLKQDDPGGRGLPRSDEAYPAIVQLDDGEIVAILERAKDELLVARAGDAEPVWTPRIDIAARYAGGIRTVWADPDVMRDSEAPWHAKGRQHWFWSELRRERKAYRPVLVASFIINLLALSLPLFSMNVYDRVIPNKAVASLWVLAVGVLLAFALEYALRLARANVIDQIGRKLDLRLSQKIYARLLSTPLTAKQGHTGALAARVAEYAVVRDFFASTSIVLMVDLAFLVVFVAAIAWIAGWLALVPVVAIILMAIAGFILQRKTVEAARDAQADAGLQQTMLVESIAGMETVKAMGAEGGMIGRWHALAEIGSRSQERLRKIATAATSLTTSFQQISTISLVIGGYYLFDAGVITMGAIIAIVMLASRSLAPAGQIAFLLTRGRQAKETLASIERLFEAEDERRGGASSSDIAISQPTVRAEGLDFAYPGASASALKGIDLTIRPGERVALIGRVASGKSTLGRVLCGLYEPTDGALLVDGVDSRQFRPQALREAFRFVGQDAALFTGSIKDNLTLGRRGTPDERLQEVLRATGADTFLARDAGGIDRQVGEQGHQLSGGQRSFVALSRGLVGDAQLLFLDEPTGAMDSVTEKLFVERLKATLGARQSLVVATHRPALFDLCDRIIVLDQGRIVADGPKAEILARSQPAREAGA